MYHHQIQYYEDDKAEFYIRAFDDYAQFYA